MLPDRKPKKPNRDSRWRSPAHCAWVRGFKCCVCGSAANIAAAHVRLGSNAGISRKPDDWRTVPLCDGPNANADEQLGCHNRQHIVGERTFWADAKIDPEQLIRELIEASPKRHQIEQEMRERGL